jgi:hypothetical protein
MALIEPTTTTWAPTWRTRSAFWWILLSAPAIAVFAPLPHARATSPSASGAP